MLLHLYDVIYGNGHVICVYCFMSWWLFVLQVILRKALLMVSYLIYLVMWSYGASHDHCTYWFGMGALVSVLYVLFIWSMECEMLTWLYDNMSSLMIMLCVDETLNLYLFYGICIEYIHMT